MLDAVSAACRAAATRHDEGKWPVQHGHAIGLQRQEIVLRKRHVIKIVHEGSWRIHHDFTIAPPNQSLDVRKVSGSAAVIRLISGIVTREKLLDIGRTI